MLGHQVPFKYCRSVNMNLPCRMVIDCWKGLFPVEDFVRIHFSEEEIASFLQPPKPKLVQIYELMRRAAEREKSG